MKKLLVLMGSLMVLIISACNSSEGSTESLIEPDNVIGGAWINYNGDEIEDSDMKVTEAIEYDSSNVYEINRSSYVSYYNGDEFLETILYSEEPPIDIQTVEEADTIRISFNVYNADSITLRVK